MSSVPNGEPNLITTSGTVTPSEINIIDAASALTLILGLPTYDGQKVEFIDQTGHAHVVQCDHSPGDGLNAANGYLTFGGTAGDAFGLVGYNSRWYTRYLNGVTVT